MIQASQLARRYQLGKSYIDAVAGITLSVQQGEKIAVIGRSGSGRSTLLNSLNADSQLYSITFRHLLFF